MGGGNSVKKHHYEQDTIRKRNEQLHAERIRQLDDLRQQQKDKIASDRLRDQQEHDRKLEIIKKEAERQQQQHEKEMEELKQKQKDKAIRGLESKISQCNSNIKQSQNNLIRLNGNLQTYTSDFKMICEEKKKFPEKRKKAITEWKRENKYNDIFTSLKRAKDEIEKAIAKTSLLESNVGKFLYLTQGLVNITTSNQVNAIKLSAIISVFGETLERETQPSLTIESYFKRNRLDRLVEPLHNETYKLLEDLEFDEEDDKEEYDDLIKIINESLGDKPINRRELRGFKKICFKPETWKKENDDKMKLTKKGLNKMAPVLGLFFNSMYKTMNLTDKILSIEENLNGEQQIALEDYQNYKIKYENINMNLKQIKNTSNDNNNNDENDKNTSEELKSEEKETEENDDTNITLLNQLNENDEKINKLQLEKSLPKQVVTQTQMLTEAAIVSVNVIQGMQKQFEDIEDDRALNLAIGIQDSCMKIIRSQGQIRQSIVLAQKILSLKPSNLRDTSKKLWDAVDSGVIQIYNSVLKMTETSSKFFGFFLKFNNSFNRFIVAQKENCSLFLSSEYLLKDVNEFQDFSKKLEKNVKLLGDEAVKVIRECIQNGAGAEIFEKAQEEREKFQKIFDELQKDLIKLELKFDMEENAIYTKFFDQQAKINTCNFEISQANQNLNVYTDLRKRCENEIIRINKM